MISTRCLSCNGSGRLMGGGMIMMDCENCNGKGKNQIIHYEELKKTKSYNEAIEKIKKSDENISDEKADEIFKNEFNKIEIREKKIGRPKNGAPRG